MKTLFLTLAIALNFSAFADTQYERFQNDYRERINEFAKIEGKLDKEQLREAYRLLSTLHTFAADVDDFFPRVEEDIERIEDRNSGVLRNGERYTRNNDKRRVANAYNQLTRMLDAWNMAIDATDSIVSGFTVNPLAVELAEAPEYGESETEFYYADDIQYIVKKIMEADPDAEWDHGFYMFSRSFEGIASTLSETREKYTKKRDRYAEKLNEAREESETTAKRTLKNVIYIVQDQDH